MEHVNLLSWNKNHGLKNGYFLTIYFIYTLQQFDSFAYVLKYSQAFCTKDLDRDNPSQLM